MEFIHNADLIKDMKPTEWLIYGILEAQAFYHDFGDPGHYKTFVALDRLLCIATGLDYHGHKVKQGTVFYIAAEGQQGLARRILAWHIAHKTTPKDTPFFLSKTPAQLIDRKSVQDMARSLEAMEKEYGTPSAIHFDTFARNIGAADENNAGDVSQVISNLDQVIGNDFARGFTHHTGHSNKERARGSMALKAALDAEYRIELHPGGQIEVRNTKMKDSIPPEPMYFDRHEILLQIGNQHESSMVLDLAIEGEDAGGRTSNKRELALEILKDLYVEHQERLTSGGYDTAKAKVGTAEWKDACKKQGLYPKKQNFYRMREALVKKEIILDDPPYTFLKLVGAENGGKILNDDS